MNKLKLKKYKLYDKYSDLNNIEKKLVESEARGRKLLNLFPDGVMVHCNGILTFANTALARLLNYDSTSELCGKHFSEITHPDFRQIWIDRTKITYCSTQVLSPQHYKLKCLNNDYIDVEATSTIYSDHGEKIIITAVRDIRDRVIINDLKRKADEKQRLLEDAMNYDKLKTDFFANLSHEFKTPLNVILASNQLINYYIENEHIDGEVREKVNKNLSVMKQNCNRLLRLINNILDITTIDSGFYNLNYSTVNIITLIEDITLSVTEYVKNKGINLIFDTDVEEKFTSCDTEKIERIMLNLLSNATKFTNAGGEIMVNILDRDDSIDIYVKDTGIGIESDKLEIIFERFRQVDKTFSRNHEGSGIGLSLVKSLVEMHSGTISVTSEYNCGSTFIINLPINVIETEPYETMFISKEIQTSENLRKTETEFSDIYTA